jgi:ketosteroid isomerase-like protein
MFNSAFAGTGDDAIFIFRNKEIKGRDNIKAQIIDVVGPLVTSHAISNVRIDLKEDGKTAAYNAYVLAQHCPPGRGQENDGPKWLATAEYFVDLIKDESDGSWKIQKWVIEILWAEGDVSVMPKV